MITISEKILELKPKYKVICESDDKFANVVQSHIDVGWIPWGGIAVVNGGECTFYIQSMIYLSGEFDG